MTSTKNFARRVADEANRHPRRRQSQSMQGRDQGGRLTSMQTVNLTYP